MRLPMPQNTKGIIDRFKSECFVVETEKGYGITELGALVLAKNFRNFDSLSRKSIRVIVYKGKNKILTGINELIELVTGYECLVRYSP